MSKYGYQYLKHLSRLASVGNFDINTTFDDHQEVQIKEKFLKIIEAIDKEIELTTNTLKNLPNSNLAKGYCNNDDCTDCPEECILYHNYVEYISKLERFKRFFKYRVLLVRIQESKEEVEAIEKEIKSIDLNGFKDKIDNDLLEIKLSVISQYFIKYFDNGASENDRLNNLFEQLKDIEWKLLDEEGIKESAISLFYFNTAFNVEKTVLRERVDRYKTLRKIANNKITGSNKHIKYQEPEIRSLLRVIQKKEIVEYTFGNDDELKKMHKFNVFSYWSKRSRYLRRQIYNTMVSLILGIELNENMFISKKSKKLLNYYELRLAVAVRNGNVDTKLLADILKEYVNEFTKEKFKFRIIDYSIYEAIHYFKTFAREARYVDKLILVHKYTTELWENGSKYMHFYTLHNQSHAIELIVNINSILKSIDYLKISKFDFYILYIACYLHDIAMVLYPNYDLFMKDSNTKANKMTLNHVKSLKTINPLESYSLNKAKRQILDLYKSIEVLFETEVRDKHARNSASFIRKSHDLKFLEEGIIDYVADVSYSHGMDAKDVFYLKSNAAERSISLKFMMILLRLSDLLDMNENRVSVPIFHNNKDKMSEITKFHWISHLITGRYEFINSYSLASKENSFLEPESIKEMITLWIDVKINQLTSITMDKTGGCKCVEMEDYIGNDKVVLNILDHEENCKKTKCNFVCKWFNKKNNWLIHELSHLQEYLSDVEGYFDTKFRIVLDLSDNNILRSEDFDDLRDFINE